MIAATGFRCAASVTSRIQPSAVLKATTRRGSSTRYTVPCRLSASGSIAARWAMALTPYPEPRESGYLPSFVNLQALLSRLSRICLSRMESAVSGATFSFASTKEMREEPEQPVKLPHLHNLGSPAYLELSGTMVGRAGLHFVAGLTVLNVQKTTRSRKDENGQTASRRWRKSTSRSRR